VSRATTPRRADAVLDTIRVRGASTSSLVDPTGFERQRGSGPSVYVTEDEIGHRRATTTDQLGPSDQADVIS
jgi:hypothetical protein